MRGRLFIAFLIVLFALSVRLSVPSVYAVVSPDFPSCVNPQGSLKVEYNQGTHGVIGNSNEFKGKDSVYTISENQTLQCLCTDNGQGIQTNWWKVSSLTADQINILISQGWTKIPDGSAWGLDSSPYLARNIDYSCSGSGNSTGGVGGQVLGASTGSVLGLATTGNTPFILSVILSGLIFLSLGAAITKIKNDTGI